MNTAISYMYRDADNYKETARVVLSGELSKTDLADILAARDENFYFIPSQVGLDDLQEKLAAYGSGDMTDSDHVWHELEDDAFEATDETPTNELTVAELADRFRTVKWNIGAALALHGISA